MIRAAVLLALLVGAATPACAQNPGQGAYLTNCSACHRPDGEGIKGAFPALAGDPFVRGDPAAVAALVLKGRGGMPSFANDLTDAQIAAAITYIRGAWGASAQPVSAALVSSVRSGASAPPKRRLQSH